MKKTNGAPKVHRRDRKTWLAHYTMLAPFLILFILLTVIPIISSVFLSLTDYNMVQFPNFVGASNYIRLFFEDDAFITAVKNTLILAVVTGPVGYILSFTVAWIINEFGRRTRVLFTLFMYMPALFSNVFFMWKYIFSQDRQGLANNVLISLGIIAEPMNWLTNPSVNLIVVAIVTLWLSFGTGFLSFMAGLQSLDRAYFEAAAIDGLKNRWQELYYVTLPQMKNFLLFGAVMSIANAFGTGSVSRELTGFPSTSNSTLTVTLHIFDYNKVRYESGYASAIAVVLFAITLLSWWLIRKILNKLSA